MIDQLEIDLMPISIKRQMKTIRIVSFYTVGCVCALLMAMLLFGVFHDAVTAMMFSLILLFATIPLLLPSFKYDKISQSKICFTPELIHILDKKGVCWRSIEYYAITDVRIEELSGFFYGENKDMYRNKYICVFINGKTDIPDVPFEKLFDENDFIMFAYHPEALQWIQKKCIS